MENWSPPSTVCQGRCSLTVQLNLLPETAFYVSFLVGVKGGLYPITSGGTSPAPRLNWDNFEGHPSSWAPLEPAESSIMTASRLSSALCPVLPPSPPPATHNESSLPSRMSGCTSISEFVSWVIQPLTEAVLRLCSGSSMLKIVKKKGTRNLSSLKPLSPSINPEPSRYMIEKQAKKERKKERKTNLLFCLSQCSLRSLLWQSKPYSD